MDLYEYDLDLANLTMHLDTLLYRREKLGKRLNVCQSLCEFYSYGTPPDFIFYIGEALGETASLIPLRTGEADEMQLPR